MFREGIKVLNLFLSFPFLPDCSDWDSAVGSRLNARTENQRSSSSVGVVRNGVARGVSFGCQPSMRLPRALRCL